MKIRVLALSGSRGAGFRFCNAGAGGGRIEPPRFGFLRPGTYCDISAHWAKDAVKAAGQKRAALRRASVFTGTRRSKM
jgi:hypothetical protein